MQRRSTSGQGRPSQDPTRLFVSVAIHLSSHCLSDWPRTFVAMFSRTRETVSAWVTTRAQAGAPLGKGASTFRSSQTRSGGVGSTIAGLDDASAAARDPLPAGVGDVGEIPPSLAGVGAGEAGVGLVAVLGEPAAQAAHATRSGATKSEARGRDARRGMQFAPGIALEESRERAYHRGARGARRRGGTPLSSRPIVDWDVPMLTEPRSVRVGPGVGRVERWRLTRCRSPGRRDRPSARGRRCSARRWR